MSSQRDLPPTAVNSFGITDPLTEPSDKVTSFLPRAFTKATFVGEKKETPLDVLYKFIKEIQEAECNHEDIANKYLELYDRESKFIIKSKEVKKFLPNFNIKSEKKLLTLFGVTPTGAMNPKDPKDTFYFFSPHQYILTTMVHAVSYATFEDRIDFAFMMYDSDNDGKISKSDLKEMFTLYGRENAFRIDNDNLESIIEVIFNGIGQGPDGLISLADFRLFFQGERAKSIKINVFERRKAKTHFSKIETKPSTRRPNNNGILPKIGKWCDSLFNLMQKSTNKLIWMILWGLGLLYFFISTFLMYYSDLGVAAGIAKGSAMVVDYNMAFMIVLATKSLTTIIRTLRLDKFLPVNNNIYMHTRIGFVTLGAAWVHSLAHLIFVLPMIASMSLAELQEKLLNPPSETHSYLWWVFRSLPGWTGIVALAMITVLVIMAIKKLRNKNYERFWYTHFLWLPMFVLLSIHGIRRYLGNPKFYYYGGIPAVVLILEKLWVLVDFFRKPFSILDMAYLDSEVIELKVIRPPSFKYIPGQYCLVKIPRLSNYQWHPFSLSSSPDDEYISFHISPVGDWTNEAKKLALDFKAKKLNKVPSIFVLGPYGAPSQHYGDYQHLMIVSSGIGATPFASIMRHLNSQVRKDPEANARTKSVDFYWVNKKPSSHIWLASLFKELQANEAVQGLIRINMFFTSPHEKYDLRSILLWKGIEMLNAQGTKVKGLEYFDLMRWGRPEWSEIFEQKAAEIKSGTVGVFFCGNAMLAKELHDNCVRHSGSVVFKFCKEIF